MSKATFITLYKEAELADDMADTRRGTAWDALVVTHKQFKEDDKWLEALRVEEDKYMEDMYGDVPAAKKSDGAWKYRKFNFTNEDGEKTTGGLPMAYLSAKSTIKQAREHSVKMMKDGKVLPKDRLTKAVATAKDTTTPYQKALNHFHRLEGVWGTLTLSEQESILSEVATLKLKIVIKAKAA